MSYRGDVFAPGCYYHIYNRGAGKGLLFFNSGNEEWPYSNYLEWIGQRGGTLKDEALIRGLFSTPEEYRQFVNDYQDEAKARECIRKYIWD